MNVGDVKLRVSRAIGDDDKLIVTDADMLRWINDGQLDVVRRTECLQGTYSTTTTLGTGAYNLPADYFLAKRVTLNNQVQRPTNINQVDDITSDSNLSGQTFNATSGYYYVFANQIYVDPNSTGGTLFIQYVKLPATLTVDGDALTIPLHMHEDVVRYTLAMARERLDQGDEAMRSLGRYEARLAESRHDAAVTFADTYPAVRLLPGDY